MGLGSEAGTTVEEVGFICQTATPLRVQAKQLDQSIAVTALARVGVLAAHCVRGLPEIFAPN